MPDPVSTASSYLGTPYVFGGATSGGKCKGLDCSGLVQAAYPKLPRTAHEQYAATQRLSDASQLQKGDLVFLHNTQRGMASGSASHVGIYDGAGNVIHASSSKGKVISVPLSQFTSSKNFFGFGRASAAPGNPVMPKPPTKSSGLASAPALQSAPINLSGVTDQDGNLDPTAFLLAALAQRQEPAALPYYTPYDPVQHSIPNLYYSAAYGDGVPQNLSYTTPSLADQRNASEQQALKNQVTPSEQEQAKLKSIANLYKAQADVLAAHPAPEMQVPDLPPMPQRQYMDIPGRPAPGFDPVSGGPAALAGLVDPQRAGAYGAAPMQAAISVADQQYQDRMHNYQMATQQLSQQYEDQLAARNEAIQNERAKASANFQNATAKRQNDIQAGDLGAQSTNANDQATTLGGFIPREQAAAKAALDAQQASRTIQEQLQQNAAATQYNLGQQQRDNQMLRDLLNYGGRVYGADQRLQGTQDTNQTRKEVGAAHDQTQVQIQSAHDASREKAANTRAAALVQAAQIRSSAVGSKIKDDLSKLPAGLRDKVQRAGQVWAAAEKEVSMVMRDASKAYDNDLSGSRPADKNAYIEQYIQPFRVRAAAYQQQYEQLLQNAAKQIPAPPAKPAAAPAKPGANPPAARPSNTLPPGFSNVRIR